MTATAPSGPPDVHRLPSKPAFAPMSSRAGLSRVSAPRSAPKPPSVAMPIAGSATAAQNITVAWIECVTLTARKPPRTV